jgi:hypothetical protein
MHYLAKLAAPACLYWAQPDVKHTEQNRKECEISYFQQSGGGWRGASPHYRPFVTLEILRADE